MESIGARFQTARESKGYTLEQVARDTHIAKRFLEALENEEFEVFPGEPYLLGFMRTYSEYLGLAPEETVGLYRNIQLQEQPAPIDELINTRPRGRTGRVIAIVAAVVVVVGGGLYLLFSGVLGRTPADEPAEPVPTAQAPSGETFEVLGDLEQRFSQGDRIVFPAGDSSYNLDIVSVGDKVALSVGDQAITASVGVEIPIDANEDDQVDLRLIVRSVDTLDSPPTLVMRLDRGAVRPASQTVESTQEPTTATAAAATATTGPGQDPDARLITRVDRRDEFVVEILFGGNCFFRYEVDDEPRVEQYFQRDQVLRLSVRDQIMVWASNAAAARLRVAGADVSLGNPGEVTAARITWAANSDTDPRLEIITVY